RNKTRSSANRCASSRLLPRGEDLSQGILKARIAYFGHWQIVPNASLFLWRTVLPRKILTPLGTMMLGPLSPGSLITLPTLVPTRSGSRLEVIVQVVSWQHG